MKKSVRKIAMAVLIVVFTVSTALALRQIKDNTAGEATYEEAMAKVKGGLHPGAVYLFHTESTANVSIMGDFIDWARGQGYEFLPICDVK